MEIIKNIIQEYYKNIDEQFNQQFFNSYLDIYELNEKLHINNIFNKCIIDLKNLIIANKNNIDKQNKLLYTNWNFLSSEMKCKKISDSTINYPIYIIIINSKISPKYASVINRVNNDIQINDITINIWNNIIITINIALCNTPEKITSSLKHEFQHILDMYIIPDENLLNKPKNNDGYSISNDFINSNDKNDNTKLNILHKIIQEMIYQLSISEQTGRIAATNNAVKQLNQNQLLTIYKKINPLKTKYTDFSYFDKTIQLIKYFDEYNQLNNFIKYKEKFNSYIQIAPERILLLGYYLIKYNFVKSNNIIKNSLSFQYIYEIIINNDYYELNSDDYKTVNIIVEYINNNFLKYQKKLYSNIYDIIYNKENNSKNKIR